MGWGGVPGMWWGGAGWRESTLPQISRVHDSRVPADHSTMDRQRRGSAASTCPSADQASCKAPHIPVLQRNACM